MIDLATKMGLKIKILKNLGSIYDWGMIPPIYLILNALGFQYLNTIPTFTNWKL